jgi:CheY-like chemotaxis protein
LTSRRVLIVDDHPVNRQLPGMLLRGTDWQCDTASSGEEALAKLNTTNYDVVLLDISMPDLSGDEVCRRIRADVRIKTLRVIAYTAHAMEEARASILAAGFDGLLTKPISKLTLFEALGSATNTGEAK